MQVTPLYGVWGSALENFGFGPYVKLGEPTYGFVHDFHTCFLDAIDFGRWYWTRWFSVHGIGCFGMYKYVL